MSTTFINASGSTTVSIVGELIPTQFPTGYTNADLIEIIIGSDVTSIGYAAFTRSNAYGMAPNNPTDNYTNLESVTFPDTLHTIGDYAFYNCNKLTSLTFPDSLVTIKNSAFSSCSGLKHIIFGNSVDSIGDQSFADCASLETLRFTADVSYIRQSEAGALHGAFGFNVGSTVQSHDGLILDIRRPLTSLTLGGIVFAPPAIGVPFFGATVAVSDLSPTCFPAGTPVQTDQGVTAIEQLVPGEHTLRGKNIVAITQTRPLQKHIVCFEKDSIGKNVPSQQTLCSKEHKVLYRGEMIKARDLADMCKNVKKVAYNGETLYNVLLEKHGKMLVNNMICETLHPENIAAKFAKMENKSEKRILTR